MQVPRKDLGCGTKSRVSSISSNSYSSEDDLARQSHMAFETLTARGDVPFLKRVDEREKRRGCKLQP